MSAQQNEFVGPIPQAVLRSALVRLGMLAVCAACVGLVFWSLRVRLQPVNQELRSEALELSRLSDAVEELRRAAKPGAAEETRAQYLAAQQMLFNRPEDFRAWQTQLRRKATALALEVKVNLEPARPYPGAEERLACAQADIEITPFAVAGIVTNASPYFRMLGFMRGLTTGDRRCDLMSLTVEGSSNSVRRAEAVALLLTAPKEAK